MYGLVILNWKNGHGETKIEKIDLSERKDLLPAFMKSTGLFFLPSGNCLMPEPTVDNYLSFLSAGRVWEISGQIDFAFAAEACIALLEGK